MSFSLIFTLQSKSDVIAQELNYDLLSVDGSAYSGNAGPFVGGRSLCSESLAHSSVIIGAAAGPPAQEVTSEMQITWVSDHSITKSGWEICIVFPESESWSKYCSEHKLI